MKISNQVLLNLWYGIEKLDEQVKDGSVILDFQGKIALGMLKQAWVMLGGSTKTAIGEFKEK